ncbi:Panacea domain-containing protein [Pedobacter sp. MC2016-15]|uniref:Panacea domain-containing protein n=1 Tax=Pedobacter sp. MC2016-15 TaxID=2994473 RepID=UPI002245224C|nr:Panacea domain-containing protein [Pedobacter sp. MC2016-15]MCX2478892.1 Panacea domain-containing protein [Pedobacter sp. MC2016-15]
MQGFNVNKIKTLNAALYVLNHLGEADCHKTFKILYFADQAHLKTYGRPITGDAYQAMNFGPVPSFLYDIFKAAEKGSHPLQEAMEVSHSFSIRREAGVPIVTPTKDADVDELAESEINVLNKSLTENEGLNFEQLVTKSHDHAWIEACENVDIEMSYLNIAKAAGTSDDMLSYITLNAENDQKIY